MIIQRMINFSNQQQEDSSYRASTDALLAVLPEIGTLSLESLAERCNISTATLIRLVQKFGCQTFSQFRTEVSQTLNNYPLYNRPIPLKFSPEPKNAESYFNYVHSLMMDIQSRATRELLDAIAARFNESNHIFIFASPSTAMVSLQTDLAVSGKKFTFLTTLPSSLPISKSDDVITFLFDKSILDTEYSTVRTCVKEYAKQGAKTVAILPDDTPGIQELVDYPLSFLSTKSEMDHFQTMIMLNLLCLRYRYYYIA